MKRAKIFILCLLAVAFLSVSPVHSTPVPFQNGDFGIFTGPDPEAWSIGLPVGDTRITGWTVIVGAIDYIGGYWQNPPGTSRSLDLNSSNTGGIQQTFLTTLGTQYTVNFYLAGNPMYDPNNLGPKKVLVDLAGLTYTFDATGKTKQNMGWELESFTFTANSDSTTLSFVSQSGGSTGPAIGGVSVSEIPLPPSPPLVVPIPPSLLLFGSGLVGLAGWRRFRKV